MDIDFREDFSEAVRSRRCL